MGSTTRPIMETFYLYDDRKLKCSLDTDAKSAPDGAPHYLTRNGYSIISNLFHPDKEFDLRETEKILSIIYEGDYKIANVTDVFIDYQECFELPEHTGMSLFIQIDTNSYQPSSVNISSDCVNLSNNEALFFDRNKVCLSHQPVQSRYNLLGKLFNKLTFRKDDTFYRYICIDYVNE